jgi:hypothetical protein
MTDLISRSTRNEFREHLVSYTLHEIEMVFDVGELVPAYDYVPSVGGQRRSLVEQFYHRINWEDPQTIKRVAMVFEQILINLDDNIERTPDWEAGIDRRKKLLRYLARDGYDFADGHLTLRSARARTIQVGTTLERIDAPELHRQIERIQGAIEKDPALAVGTAKELVESACKTILEDRGVPLDPEWDLVRLGKEARDSLQLLPSNIQDGAKGAEAIKKLLGNLGVVVQSLGEIRNLYGTGHGRTSKAQAMQPRHARLAAGAATSLAVFLLETHWERTP